jgi:hypothetical protein
VLVKVYRSICGLAHLQCLQEFLPRITKILVVGWRATEGHFLDLLKAASLCRDVPTLVVAGGESEAQEVLSRIQEAGIPTAGKPSKGGFTDFIVSRELESF